MWIYKGSEFTSEDIEDHYAFVYEITCIPTGQKYIGKKFFYSKRTLPPLKGKKRRRIEYKESNWKDYWSSSKYVHKLIKEYGEENFTREIISLHPDKREANYAELAEQVIRNVLEARDEAGVRIYLNENIERVFYPSKKYFEKRIEQHHQRIKDASLLLG